MIEAKTVEIEGRYAPAIDVYGTIYIPPNTVALFRRHEDGFAHAEAIAKILNRLSWHNARDFISNLGWVKHDPNLIYPGKDLTNVFPEE